MSASHDTTPTTGGPDDGGDAFDWWRALDLAVWAAVVVLVALGLEFFFGAFIRERLHRTAQQIIAEDTADVT
jgi:hypothetical protein